MISLEYILKTVINVSIFMHIFKALDRHCQIAIQET